MVAENSFLVGCLGALGVFARFTFPAFALPIVRLPPALPVVASSVLTAAVIVLVDSHYYGRWVLTPLNAFLYNMDPSNLALHGIHPRYLHAFVNLPLLLGPVLLLRLRPSARWLVPLVLLSVAPHQEPRFLLPIVPAAIVSGSQAPWSVREMVIHTGFHCLCVGFFGFLHQGGIVPAVRALPVGLRVAFWKTYPPPMHLVPKGTIIVKSIDEADIVISPIKPDGFVRTESTRCWWPHLSTENFPASLEQARLCEWSRGPIT
jgi:GPI mannosyltransferase 4